YLSQTVLTFRLTVNDGVNPNVTDTVIITVVADNDAPDADAGADQVDQEAGTVVQLDGSASSDPEGVALGYSWTQTMGTAVTLDSSTIAQPSFTVPDIAANETLRFRLTVHDGVNPVFDDVD